MSAAKPSTEEAVLAALGSQPEATASEIVAATGLGRSTVSKSLARLNRDGRVRHAAGGYEEGRRRPDRWSLAAARTPSRSRGTAGKRLPPGGLDALVLVYLATHNDRGPLSPTAVANGLGRSSGAVAFAYDQHAPPADGGRPPSEAAIGGAEVVDERTVLLADVDEIAIAELHAGPAERPHVHRRHAESLYVLEGELAMTAGGRELRAPAGSWVQVPPGAPHAVGGSARFPSLHTPSCGFGAFLREGAAFDQEPAA